MFLAGDTRVEIKTLTIVVRVFVNIFLELFYVVRFNMSALWFGYTGTTDDVVQTEIPEHWLQAAK